MSDIKILEKDIRELKKTNKELVTHNKFLEERLENWADKNFDLRQKNQKLTEEIEVLKPNFVKEKND